MEKELTPKQQTSEALRQAETVLIMTGQHPSIDQVSAVVALSALLHKFGKKVTAVISDDIPASAKFMPTELIERNIGGLRDFIMRVDLSHAEVDKLKYTIENGKLNIHVTPFAGGFKPNDVSYDYGDYDYDLVLVLGVASYGRIDRVYTQNAELLRKTPLINIDFHRSNEQYGAVNLIEPTAASLSEILMALSESLQAGLIDDKIATVMLTGIMASTDRFTATHTTSKTMTVAAQMMAAGADQQKVVRALYRDRGEVRERKPQIAAQPPRIEPQAPSQSRPEAPSAQATAMPPAKPQFQPIELASPPVLQASQPESAHLPNPIDEPTIEPAPAEPKPERLPIAELLPPQHIEMSEPEPEPEPAAVEPAAEPVSAATEPEPEPEATLLPPADLVAPDPLINSFDPPKPSVSRGSNPTNNPTFAQRLDEFEY